MTNEVISIEETTALQDTSIRNLYERFINYLDCSPKTVQTYQRAIRQFVNWVDDNGISRPQRQDVINWRDGLMEDHKATTVQSYIVALKQFFAWTADEGLYPEITRKVKGAKVDKDAFRKDALTAGQAAICLDKIETDTPKGRRDYAIFLLMSSCGLRCIEVQRANIEDLRAAGGKTVLYLQGKGRQEKTQFVVIPQEIESAIRESLSDRPTATGSDPLFASDSHHNGGGRLTTRSISRIAKGRMIDAGFNSDRLTAHSLRHGAVTTAREEGQELTEVQTFARHTDPATTQIYDHSIDRSRNTCSQTVYDAIARQRAADKVRARREQQAAANASA